MSGTINRTPSKGAPDFSEMPKDEAASSVMDMLLAAHEEGRREGQSVGMPKPSEDAAFVGGGLWGDRRPVAAPDVRRFGESMVALHDELAQVAGADAPRGPSVPTPGRSLINTKMIPERLASSREVGYTPPFREQGAITRDYPNGVPVDEFGNISHTPEGVPLTSENVAGRRALREANDWPDRPVDREGIIRGGSDGGGARILGVPAGRLPRNTAGSYNPQTKEIRYDKSLIPGKRDNVIAHEVGHLIDDIAGKIPVKGLSEELKPLYDTLATGGESWPGRRLTGPGNANYKGPDVPREFIAEAIRAYMQDPNYIKEVAPRTARVIRDAVNSNPDLNKWIQFNTAAGLLSGAAAADLARSDADDDEKEGR